MTINLAVTGGGAPDLSIDGGNKIEITVNGQSGPDLTATTGDTVTLTVTAAGAPGGQGIQGPPGSVNLSDDTPQPLGTAAAGSSVDAARSDHVHAVPTIAYSSLTGAPSLATVATSGKYSDLTGTPSAYTLPTASAGTLGGVKVGENLTITDGVLSAAAGVSLSSSTPEALGTAAAGTASTASRSDHVHAMPSAGSISGLAAIATSGSASDLSTGTVPAARLPVATGSTAGAVKVGTGLTISSGVLSADGGIAWASVPSSSSASGTAGSLAYDSAYLYCAVDTNTWKRVALSTWGGGGGGYGGSFTPTAVILTSGTSYQVPAGATSMKAWAVGPGAPFDEGAPYPGRAGGVAYKTWSVSGGQSIAYAIGSPGFPDYPSYYSGSSSSVTVSGQTITAHSGDWFYAPGGYSVLDGDGGATGSLASGNRGGPIGSGTFPSGTCRASAGDVSGLLAAVALAGGKATEDCEAQPAFGSGGTSSLSPGRGGGAGLYGGVPPNGAVVLYFT